MSETEINEVVDLENEANEGGKKRVYELGYLLLPTISEENTLISFDNLKELIGVFGGEIISSEMPRMIRLAYIMTKVINNVRSRFDSAYFGWVKFEMESSQAIALKKKLDFNPELIRFLIIKTVRENTIAPKRYTGGMAGRFKSGIDRKEEKKDELPIDEEVVDKEIDALAEAAS